ncbi:MAG: radical SAM protein [Nanoarchaeota archaeon]
MKIKKTVIFVGYECNNLCTFCLNSNKRGKIPKKSTEEVYQDIINAKKDGTSYLEFIGGETTIRPDFFRILDFANKLKFETIMIATNGRMFSDEKFARKALELGLNHIVFSIHGHNEELHDSLTLANGSFSQMIKGIKNLKKLGFENIGSNTTIVKQNYTFLPEIADLIDSLGISNSEFIFVDPNQGAPKDNFDEIVPTFEETSPYINEILKFGKQKNKTHWTIRYYPLCYIESKFHDMVSEIQEVNRFELKHIAKDFINRDVFKGRKEVGKIKTEKCNTCPHINYCEGFWKEYVIRRQLK